MTTPGRLDTGPEGPGAGIEQPSRAGAAPRPEAPFAGFRLGRVAGVEVRIDASLLIIFALITFNLGAVLLPSWHPEWDGVTRWATALAAAVLFFGSVLAHELSHAIVGRSQGVPVRQITLFLFGGVAHMEGEPPSPKAELAMAIVGPIASLVIGALATALGSILAGEAVSSAIALGDADVTRAALASIGPVETLLLWLGPVNIALGLFNLVPGFPLDGGRVLRAAIWGITGDLTKATRWASRSGQVVAWSLMAIGAMNLFGGAIGQGLWLLLIGWFLNNAARTSYQQLLLQQAFDNVPVARVMQTRLERIRPELPIEVFVREHLMTTEQRAFPVEADGVLLGLVCFDDVRRVPQSEWPTTAVEAIMTAAQDLTTVPPDAPASRALNELGRRDVDQLPVVEGHRLVGVVRRGDLLTWLALQQPAAIPYAVSRGPR